MAVHLSHDERPPVSIVVPFRGSADEARATMEAIAPLVALQGDEALLVDNGPGPPVASAAGVRVIAAPEQASSYYARNVGVDAAANEWVLFLDADCRPAVDLLGAYFAEAIPDGCGALAGEIDADDGDGGVVARFSRDRDYLSQAARARFPFKPAAVTANLLVRRRAYDQVGGFLEGIRSGGDSDFCWRLQDAGWSLGYRDGARVAHRHRDTLTGLVRQLARYGAGRRWLARRHPGSFGPWRPGPQAARAAAAAVRWGLSGDAERARFRALDALAVLAEFAGGLVGNGPVPEPAGHGKLVVMADRFPALSESFVANEVRALRRAGRDVRIEALWRPARPDRVAARELPASYGEDDAVLRRLADTVWLVTRHPRACARDLAARRRWMGEEMVLPLRSIAPLARRLVRRDERHVHVHFAAHSALVALRLHSLIGITYSVAAHAYEIYREPANLPEKLRGASFVAASCAYTAADLRALAGADAERRVVEVIVGVEPERFVRSTPYPDGRTVVAVGRLVEKKGFGDLVAAAALLRDRGVLERIVIAGDGPLRAALAAQIEELGLRREVELAGALEPDAVRGLLERAAVLAMPCVVAADGDRDSMPVVVKEALAMEVPVVGSDEVGLPEIVMPPWGRLAPPHDPDGLAAALIEVLTLSREQRHAMGRAGRAFVVEHCNVDRETAKLLARLPPTAQSTAMR